MEYQALQHEIEELLESVAAEAPDFPLGNVRDLVRYGEPRIALENLCDNLCELSVRLKGGTRSSLVRLSKACGLDPVYWEELLEG